MNKWIIIILCTISFFLIDATISYAKKSEVIKEDDYEEIRAIYISYLEYLNYFQGNSITTNKTKINKIIDAIKEKGYNTLILHVSPFSDSIYKSQLFPYSHTLTGIEGKNPGFDFLEYFIKRSHAKNINVYGWINPYRISFENKINSISKNNPAYKLLNTTNVYIDKNGIYYNPASSVVKNLIINQVNEIIDNYDIDGIHFDDYFYIQSDIDKEEYNNYKKNGGKMTLKEFRLSNISDLVKRVYKTIKSRNKNIVFSIAPDGNINNNYLYHFADVKNWLRNSDYVDIIMPQVYYGFKNEYSPYEKVLNDWINLRKNKSIKIVPVLAYYKIGEKDLGAGNGINEWIEDKNIIFKQIELIHKYNLSGYGIFRYDFIVKNS